MSTATIAPDVETVVRLRAAAVQTAADALKKAASGLAPSRRVEEIEKLSDYILTPALERLVEEHEPDVDDLPLASLVLDRDFDLWVRDVEGWRMLVAVTLGVKLGVSTLDAGELARFGPFRLVREGGRGPSLDS